MAAAKETCTLVITTVQRVTLPSNRIAQWIATTINKSGDAYYGEWGVEELGVTHEEVTATVEE